MREQASPILSAVDSGFSVVSAAEMRALDAYTIEVLGVDGALLMENAGRAVCAEVLDELSRMGLGRDGRVLVLCGEGNNGGDGLVVARHLHQLGISVRVLLTKSVAALGGDPAANARRAQGLGIEIEELGACTDPAREIACADVIVDAIFGTGLSREVTGEVAGLIGQVNELTNGVGVIAVDLPSGMHADTGACQGATIRASQTITLGCPKVGLLLEPGRSQAGAVRVARIGIAERTPDVAPRAYCWSSPAAGCKLPLRPRAGHKGRFGHALIVAGSEGKTGAAVLAARGAARAGAGLVTVACAESLNAILEVNCTEMMTVPVAENSDRSIGPEAEKMLLELAEGKSCVALGPGLGQNPATQSLVRSLVDRIGIPLVLDADGLNALAGHLGCLRKRRAQCVLTPHPGEAARLLDTSAAEINGDRVGAARELAERTAAVVLLKGAGTVIAAPEGEVVLNPTGGPALASGGTGDLLTGVVAALLSQGLDAFEAAALAAYVHGAAADEIALREGDSGLLASALADVLPATMQRLREAARAVQPALGFLVSFP